MLKTGTEAPDFSLPDKNGHIHTLSHYRGLPVVVYFYPKDNSPECTKEACSFRDMWNLYLDLGIVVFGINTDSKIRHAYFSSKYCLPFPLLSDSTAETIQKYEACAAVGKTEQITYLIDVTGKICRTYQKFNVENHAQDILDDIRALNI